MPVVSAAMDSFKRQLRSCRAYGEYCIKIIHGYGSSGKGGAIKAALHIQLEQMKRSGAIAEYVKGEDFSPFSVSSRFISDACPEAVKDRDYCRSNHGVTIVLLNTRR